MCCSPTTLAFFLAAPLLGAEDPAPKPGTTTSQPSIDRLLVLNASQLFGGKLSLLGEDRFEVTFNSDGQVPAGFEGEGILDSKHPSMVGGNRKFIIKDKKNGVEVLYPGLACTGISQPSGDWTIWTSRFPVAGEARVRFEMRLPGLVTSQSGFFARLNMKDKTWLETNFFRSVEKKAHGKVLARRESPKKEYAAHPMKWFPRNRPEGVPVELAVENDQFLVKVDHKEVVSLEKVADIPSGHVAFGYKKIVFTFQNMKISGKLDRPWCEAQLKALEKAGKLVSQDPGSSSEDPVLPLPPPPPAGSEGQGGGR